MSAFHPASRFVDGMGRLIYTKVERPNADGTLGGDLTWFTALGATVRLSRRCLYLPLFFWRRLK